MLIPGVRPLNGADVAAIVPEPVKPSEQPVPQSIAAVVFVPLVIEEKAELPPPEMVLQPMTPVDDVNIKALDPAVLQFGKAEIVGITAM